MRRPLARPRRLPPRHDCLRVLCQREGQDSTAVGFAAKAYGDFATAIGLYAGNDRTLSVTGATSIGTHALVDAPYGTAIGGSSDLPVRTTAGYYSVAIGGGDERVYRPYGASGDVTVQGARASGQLSIALGTASLASGTGGVASAWPAALVPIAPPMAKTAGQRRPEALPSAPQAKQPWVTVSRSAATVR